MLETKEISKIRSLINPLNHDYLWKKEVIKLLETNEKSLTNKNNLKKLWKKDWGKLKIKKLTGRSEITWERSDGGPKIVTSVEDKLFCQYLIKMILRGLLSEKLNSGKFLSFAKVGYPKEWNRCKIYLNDQEIDNVYWACSITGMCETTKFNKKGEIAVDKKGDIENEQKRGIITIIVQKDNQSFF